MVPVLVVFGGLPATGKSTLAQTIAVASQAAYLRLDTLEYQIRTHGFIDEDTDSAALARLSAWVVASDNLRVGRPVVVDAYNGREEARQAWRSVAADCRCRILEVHVTCLDRAEHRRRADERQVEHDGRKPVRWERIAGMDFDPWPEAHLVVDTAGKSTDAAAADVLAIF